MSTLNETPMGGRIHIGIFGRTNAGKSSLLNAVTKQPVSIVSELEGTTTDPVYKAMELNGIGPCVFIDTAGIEDYTKLAKERSLKTREVAEKTDIALIVVGQQQQNIDAELKLYKSFSEMKRPVIFVINMTDKDKEVSIKKLLPEVENVCVNALTGEGAENIRDALLRTLPREAGKKTILSDKVSSEDMVLLVMPQDIQAPKGRLILPQVQTIRELLDKNAVVVSVTADGFKNALKLLVKPPKLIITDSQVFKYVYENKPEESLLTSFSVLFAALKGDIDYYKKSADVISQLDTESRVLIAECCTHAPMEEDIGRVKIPALLRKRAGGQLKIDVTAGTDFPQDLSAYDLVIQCGGCMFNEKYVMSRIDRAKKQGVPMTNYGIAIAYLNGILDKISI